MNAGSSRTSGAQAWGTSEPSHHLLPGSDDRPAWWPPGSLYCSWGVWTQLESVSVASWIRAQGPFPPVGAWPFPWPLLPQPGQLPGPAARLTASGRPVAPGPLHRPIKHSVPGLAPLWLLSHTGCWDRQTLGPEVQPTRCPQGAPSLQPQSPSSRVFAPPCFVLHADPPPNSTPIVLRGGLHPLSQPSASPAVA